MERVHAHDSGTRRCRRQRGCTDSGTRRCRQRRGCTGRWKEAAVRGVKNEPVRTLTGACTAQWNAAAQAAAWVHGAVEGGGSTERQRTCAGWQKAAAARWMASAARASKTSPCTLTGACTGQWNAAAQTAAGCTGQWKAAAARSIDNEPAHAHESVRRKCGGGRWKVQRRGATKTSLRTAHGDGAGGVARGGGRRGQCGASKLSPHMLMGACAGEFSAAAAWGVQNEPAHTQWNVRGEVKGSGGAGHGGRARAHSMEPQRVGSGTARTCRRQGSRAEDAQRAEGAGGM
ncbi:hypothetical protein GGX14DRAFT_408321 [Mycena pura]|uniref:Uncharacterized protein n=1 Tax=Mycena pura TaxID=153505 RepID=A0AAD6UN45_9AGAR|nr:hypothetical protein GGX14DRAFT_408321 [Mycena pura]